MRIRGLQRCGSALLVAVVLAGCSGGGADDGPGTEAAASASAAPPPAEGELLTSLLTPGEVGDDFRGPPPAVAGTEAAKAGVSKKPICDIKGSLERLAEVSVGPIVDPEASEQVFERLTVAESASNAEADVTAVRKRAEARCRFDETVAETTYTVTVEGPVELDVGDQAVGIALAYTGGYTGFRWDMTARRGRVLVNLQYTATEAVDRERALELLRLAVDKASVLS